MSDKTLKSEPIRIGTGTVAVHNIFDPLPAFMKEADLVFTDPPWNLAMLNNFSNRAGVPKSSSFRVFFERLFACIAEIDPTEAFVEIGKQHLSDFLVAMDKLFPEVFFYDSYYYHRTQNKSFIVHGSKITGSKIPHRYPLDGIDEDDACNWVCQNLPFNCIGDLCMGKGATGFYANEAGKRFVGTEVNADRLAVLSERIRTGRKKR